MTGNGCKKKEDKQVALSQQQVKEYAVITVESTRSVLKSAYSASIRGKQDIEIRPMVDGFITQVRVDEGSFVKKG